MALAGFCRRCGQYVWLNEQWGCVNGHPWTEISNWYDPQTGTPVTPYWLQAAPPASVPPPAPAPAPAPAVAPSDRLTLLGDVLATMGRYPNYTSQYGSDTDIVISNEVASVSWVGGSKKVEFSAIMKAVEPEFTLYYWELLKESGSGMNFGGLNAETTTTLGAQRSGTVKQTIVGPDGVAREIEWDYGATRRIIEDVAARHGWQFKTVLQKSSAQW